MLWQYGLWSFLAGGTKLERFLPKNQHTQMKLLNFENWVNGEMSKIEHYFSKYSRVRNKHSRTLINFFNFFQGLRLYSGLHGIR